MSAAAKPTAAPRPWLPWLSALILVLTLGGGMQHIWNNQLGQWAAGLIPWTVDLRLDFVLMTLGAAALAAVVSRCLHRFSGRRMDGMAPILLVGLLVVQVLCVVAAWPVAVGPMAQGIDHPAFLFRLHEFYQVFPFALGSYTPWWNAGTEHFVGVTSGVHAFGILMAPFRLVLPLERAYSVALLFWMAIGLPWLAALAFRRTGMCWSGALCGAWLLLAFTRAEFLFFWQSGNLGGMVSALLAPSVVAMGHRVAVQGRGTSADVLLLGLGAWLMCLWPPGLFTAAGLFAGWLLLLRRSRTRRAMRRTVAAGALALVLLLPWLWVEAFPARGVASYVATGVAESRRSMLEAGLGQCRRRLLEWHPLLLAVGLPAALLCRSRSRRLWLAPLAVVLFVATVSVGFKRQSQFDRVALQWAAAMAFPASIALGNLFRPGRSSIARGLAAAVALALLVLGGRVARAHYANSAGFKLWPDHGQVRAFADWIRENVPPGGRLAFAGETDCRYEWGKPAFLPILADREMMSDDYYGFPKGLTARNYPPKAYRKSHETHLAFSRAYGITHWAVADNRNRSYFEAHPEAYRKVLSDLRLQSTHVDVYRVLPEGDPTRFYQGSGEVDAEENRLRVRLSDPSASVVLRYRWRDGLRCRTPGASIAPFDVDGNLRFIEVRPGGNREIEIGYRPGWHPTPPDFDGTFHH